MPSSTPCGKIRGIRAWVSGGSGALGLGFARALLSHDAEVVILADLRPPSKDAFQQWDRVEYHCVDVRSDSKRQKHSLTVAQSLAQSRAQYGCLDLIVNNAGIIAEEANTASLQEAIDKSIFVNLKAVIEATEIGARALEDGGIIVNISSAAGIFRAPHAPLYAATKSGVVGYSRSRAKVLVEKYGVRLNVLCPSIVNGGIGKEAEKAPGWDRMVESFGIMQPEDVADALIQIVCDSDMVGQAVYVSRKTGVCFPLRGLRSIREAKL